MSEHEHCEDCEGIDCRYAVDCLDCETEQWAYAWEPTECPICGTVFVVFAHGRVERTEDTPEATGEERPTADKGGR